MENKNAIKTENRIVCFADVLGFKQMIKKYDLDSSSSILFEFKDAYQQAIHAIKKNRQEYASDKIKFQMFSDNICISMPYEDHQESLFDSFLKVSILASIFQFFLLQKGFFIRGGIAKGSYFSDENMIFSNALVNAYELESKKAIYPRIIVQEELVRTLKFKNDKINFLLISDWENTVFINPFLLIDGITVIFHSIIQNISDHKETINIDSLGLGEGISEIKKIVTHQINSIDDYNIKSKYTWLLEFIKWKKKEDSMLKFEYLS